MPIGLFDTVSRGLTQALSFHAQRHEVLAANIANVETPGYRARDIEFADALADAFGAEDVPGASVRSLDRPSGTGRPDGNTVDIDMEMARLAENRGRFTTYAEILARRLAALRRAIDGGS